MMSVWKRLARVAAPVVAVLTLAMSVAPSGASAKQWYRGSGPTFGATALVLNPSTATALTGLGVTPGVVAPAYAGPGGALEFPITTPLTQALATGTIEHTGGISLTAGGTTVDLTNFWIDLGGQDLSADVSTSTGVNLGRVTIVSLDFSGARLGFCHGALTLGPVSADLNAAAIGALNEVFGTTLTAPIPLGTATVQYSLSGFGGWSFGYGRW
jgi:hypothetical protein